MAEAEARRPARRATGTCPAEVLQGLALRELAGQLPEIGQLTITPDVVTGLVTRLTLLSRGPA